MTTIRHDTRTNHNDRDDDDLMLLRERMAAIVLVFSLGLLFGFFCSFLTP